MKKERRRLVLHATPAIFLISLFLLYSDYYGSNELKFNEWMQINSRDCLKRLMVNITIDNEHASHLGPKKVNITTINYEIESNSTSHEVIHQENSPTNEQELILGSQEINETVYNNHQSSNSTSHEVIQEISSTKEQELILGSQEINETVNNHQSSNSTAHEVIQENSSTKDQELILGSQEINETVNDHESQPIREGEIIKQDEQKLLIEGDGSELLDDKERLDRKKGSNGTVNQESQLSAREKDDIKKSPLSRLVRGEDLKELEATGFACDRTASSLVCLSDKKVRIDTNSMTVYVPFNQTPEKTKKTEVRPYQRQDDPDLLQWITPVQFIQENTSSPSCQYTHNEPAVTFSSGGFTGNLFHEFNEIIIPLFLTTLHFKSKVQYIIVDYKESFVNRYSKILSRLSGFKVMNPAAEKGVHCFPGVIAGLKFHDHLALNPGEIPGGYSMPDFRQFLKKTYNLKVDKVSDNKKPVLMLISRTTTRRFLNEGEMVHIMKRLGFEVIVVRKPERMSNLSKFSRLVNRCSVLVGTHGAGLANELFLPDGAVMIQVEPLGLEWASAFYFGKPAAAMGVHYLRYKIESEESSLLEKYGPNDPVISDPDSVFAKGYQAARAAYIDQQNMKVNISRFSETLTQALTLIGRSSPSR